MKQFKRTPVNDSKSPRPTTASTLKSAAAEVQRNADRKSEEYHQKKKKILEKIAARKKPQQMKPLSRDFSTSRHKRSKRGREDQGDKDTGRQSKSPKGARLLGTSVASIAKQLQKDDSIRRQLLMIARRGASLEEESSSGDEVEEDDEVENDWDRGSVALILSAIDTEEELSCEDGEGGSDEESDVEIFLGLPSSMMTVTSPTRRRTITPPPCGSTSQGAGKLLLGPSKLRSRHPTRCHLVLDLDETLVAARGAEVIVRPHAVDFLLTARSLECEIVLWTAGVYSHTMRSVAAISQAYGSSDWYDEIIWRSSKWYTEDVYSVKDLRLLGRPINQCLLIDNSPCVVVQPMNALIVEDFTGEGNSGDQTLNYCEIILKEVVRTLNSSFDDDVGKYEYQFKMQPISDSLKAAEVEGIKPLSPKQSPRMGPRKSPVPPIGRSSGEKRPSAAEEHSTKEHLHMVQGVVAQGVGDALMESENIITTPLPITGKLARMRKTHVLSYGPRSRRQYGGVPVDGFQPWTSDLGEKHG